MEKNAWERGGSVGIEPAICRGRGGELDAGERGGSVFIICLFLVKAIAIATEHLKKGKYYAKIDLNFLTFHFATHDS